VRVLLNFRSGFEGLKEGFEALGQEVLENRWGQVEGAATLLDEGAYAAGLEGAASLVEGVAVVAHDLAGTGDVVQFLGQLQQRQLALDTLGQSGHGVLLIAN